MSAKLATLKIKIFYFLIMFFCAIVSFGCLFFAIYNINQAISITNDGVLTVGQVTSLQENVSCGPRSYFNRTCYNVTFTYHDGNKILTSSKTFGAYEYLINEKREIYIVYSKSNPQFVAIGGYVKGEIATFVMSLLLGLFFLYPLTELIPRKIKRRMGKIIHYKQFLELIYPREKDISLTESLVKDIRALPFVALTLIMFGSLISLMILTDDHTESWSVFYIPFKITGILLAYLCIAKYFPGSFLVRFWSNSKTISEIVIKYKSIMFMMLTISGFIVADVYFGINKYSYYNGDFDGYFGYTLFYFVISFLLINGAKYLSAWWNFRSIRTN